MYTWPLSPVTQCFGTQVRTAKQSMTDKRQEFACDWQHHQPSQVTWYSCALTHCTPAQQWLPVSRAASRSKGSPSLLQLSVYKLKTTTFRTKCTSAI